MTKIEDEVTIEKYLNAIVTINSTLGRLGVLRLHLNSMYDDKMANAIIESIMKELANVSGVDYKSINIELPKRKIAMAFVVLILCVVACISMSNKGQIELMYDLKHY